VCQSHWRRRVAYTDAYSHGYSYSDSDSYSYSYGYHYATAYPNTKNRSITKTASYSAAEALITVIGCY
jgi:hypothetical protein